MLTKKRRKVLDDITPNDGFKYFSGNTENSHNHPTIYFGSGKFNVVGRGLNIECDTLEEAVTKFEKHFEKTISQ